jgi:hypothetical protein
MNVEKVLGALCSLGARYLSKNTVIPDEYTQYGIERTGFKPNNVRVT